MSFLRISLLLLVLGAVGWAAKKGFIVEQRDKAFGVERVTIRPGEKVIFQNLDDITHNIFSASKGNEFNINVQKPGGSTGVTFWNEGEVEVRCAIHPKMKMTIMVQSTTPARVSE
jgi:plastocyanin